MPVIYLKGEDLFLKELLGMRRMVMRNVNRKFGNPVIGVPAPGITLGAVEIFEPFYAGDQGAHSRDHG
jgi:hypothetical protein